MSALKVRKIHSTKELRINMSKTLAKRIDVLGLKQWQAAERLGVTQGVISKLKAGKHFFSLEKTIGFLHKLGMKVEIRVKTGK